MDTQSTIAAQAYAAVRPATAATPSQGDLSSSVADVATDFAATLQSAEMTAQGAMQGDADSHSLVHALAQSQLAVETVVTVRDKVVEAYQEILRMPV